MHSRAAVFVDEVGAVGAILAGVGGTLVRVEFTKVTFPAGQTVAREFIDSIHTRAVIEAWRACALVNIRLKNTKKVKCLSFGCHPR